MNPERTTREQYNVVERLTLEHDGEATVVGVTYEGQPMLYVRFADGYATHIRQDGSVRR